LEQAARSRRTGLWIAGVLVVAIVVVFGMLLFEQIDYRSAAQVLLGLMIAAATAVGVAGRYRSRERELLGLDEPDVRWLRGGGGDGTWHPLRRK
jgi:hypothetical protein